MMKMVPIVCGPALLAIAACAKDIPDEVSRPPDQLIASRLAVGSEGELIVGIHHSGGGAGETIHRLLACVRGSQSCEVLSALDTNSRVAPVVTAEGTAVAFVVNPTDRIGQFRSFSRTLPRLYRGSILLRYRPETASR